MIKTAVILSTGDELTTGKVGDTNSTFIADRLFALGIRVAAVLKVGDDREKLIWALGQARELGDVAIGTGGLGPTADDLSTELVAEFLGVKTKLNDGVAAARKARFVKRGVAFTPNNLKQALFPDGSAIIPNPNGTAPGCRVDIGRGLYFERFLNPARATPPDIDTDLCSRRRDGVIQHVYEQYGSERVAMVCTLNRFRHRSALREVAKAYGLDPDEVNTLAKYLSQRWYGPLDADEENQPPFAGLAKLYPAPRYQLIFRDAEALLGKPHHPSIHPGGVVIAPGRLTIWRRLKWQAKGW